jgi:signal recognition particle receptor subunit beta
MDRLFERLKITAELGNVLLRTFDGHVFLVDSSDPADRQADVKPVLGIRRHGALRDRL